MKTTKHVLNAFQVFLDQRIIENFTVYYWVEDGCSKHEPFGC